MTIMGAQNLTRMLTVAVFATGTLWTRSVRAQANPDSVHQRNDCRLAEQTIRTGHPSPHSSWAEGAIAFCGSAGARAIADRLAALRDSRDRDELQALASAAGRFSDAAIYETALGLLKNAGATEEARIVAVLVLYGQVFPVFDATYDKLAGDGVSPRANCWLGGVTDTDQFPGTQLPADARPRLIQVATAVWQDQTAPVRVRAATSCLRMMGLAPADREP